MILEFGAHLPALSPARPAFSGGSESARSEFNLHPQSVAGTSSASAVGKGCRSTGTDAEPVRELPFAMYESLIKWRGRAILPPVVSNRLNEDEVVNISISAPT